MTAHAGIDAADLLGLDLPPLRWIVPDLLSEGTTVLAAPPKVGKSCLVYQVAVEVAIGGELFGRRAGTGSALYLALEDGQRRGQTRLRAALAGRTMPHGRLDIQWGARRIGEGLEDDLTAWLDAHPDAALVAIDTLQKVRARTNGKRGAYEPAHASWTRPSRAQDYDDARDMDVLPSRSIRVDRGFGRREVARPSEHRTVQTSRNESPRYLSRNRSPRRHSAPLHARRRVDSGDSNAVFSVTTVDHDAFLAAADMLEFGEVTEETRAQMRQRISQQLRESMSEGARKAVADAYRDMGKPVPEWCRDD